MPPNTMERPHAEGLEPETFLQAHRRITDWKQKVEELAASGKAAANTANALGINLKAYKAALRLGKMQRTEAEEYLRKTLLYARWLDLGLFNQEDLFASNTGSDSEMQGFTSKVVREHKAWEAEREGYENGKFSDPLDNNPHPAGSEFHQRYVVGWHDGAAYRKEAEARGEQLIRPKKRTVGGNPEDRNGEPGED